MADFLMPSLGADMSAGTLVMWRKTVGDTVRRGDIIAEVETEKAVIEVEVFTGGVIEKILVQPGEKVPVGTPLALIREEKKGSDLKPSIEPARIRISPLARKIAAKRGIDLSTVPGTGPGGAITRADVERAAPPQEVQFPPPQTGALADRQSRMRQTIAAAMARSKREIPHYYLSTPIEMSRSMGWLSEQNLKRPVSDRFLYGVLLIKAVALALRDIPELNALWVDGKAVLKEEIHVGTAISLRQGGLVAPALHHTDRQSLDELMKNFLDLVKRARAGSLKSSEISDPTITVTSLGEQGVETVFGIIYPPQVAIVGFGKLMERPWSVEGKIVSRPLITATLSGDHRVTDGHRGGLFLAAIDRYLQEPERL
jgi:pyruvate dehydrogenase E2 component (dihydrolipoamide acetyltransferase)